MDPCHQSRAQALARGTEAGGRMCGLPRFPEGSQWHFCVRNLACSHTHQGSHLMPRTLRTQWQILTVPLTPTSAHTNRLARRSAHTQQANSEALPLPSSQLLGSGRTVFLCLRGLLGLLCLRPQDPHIEEAVLGSPAPVPLGQATAPLPLQVSVLSWGEVLSLWQGHSTEPQSPVWGMLPGHLE